MKLTTEQIAFISRVLTVAHSVGIEALLIDEDGVKAVDEGMNVFLIESANNKPEFDWDAIGIANVSGLISRLKLFEGQDFTIDATIDDRSKAVRMLTIKRGRTKADFQCALPKLIAAPRRVNDEFISQFNSDEESINLIQRAVGVMGSSQLTFNSNDEGVTAELAAVNNDIFSHTMPNKVSEIDDSGETRFIYKYPTKITMSLLRKNPNGIIKIGKRGTLNLVVDGFNLFVLQQR